MEKLENTLICQEWLEHEYEPGWGASQRGDGCTLHYTNESHLSHINDKWYSRNTRGAVPDLYSRPIGKPYKVKVSNKIIEKFHNQTSLCLNLTQTQMNRFFASGDLKKV